MSLPRYPEYETAVTEEGIVGLPSEATFNCFQRDAVGVRVRTVLAPSSPGRTARIAEVRFVVSNYEWLGWSVHDRDEFARSQLEFGIRYRTATMS